MAEYENIIDLDKLGRFHDNLKAKGLPLNDWQVNKEYKVGYTVIQDGKLYRCKTEHTSTTTFDDTKWSVVSSSGISYYTSNTSYKVDDQVIYDNKIYKCIMAHISTNTFDSAKWEELSSGGGISIWQPNTDYDVNDVVIDSNLIWQCAIAHTSTTTFDESKWVCISGGEISNGMEIVPLWEGDFSFSNSTEGATSTSSTQMIELSESISNFEYIRIFTRVEQADKDQASNLGYVPYLINNGSMRCGVVATNSVFATCEAKFYDSTHVFIYHSNISDWPSGQISRIEGIRKAKPIVSSGMKYETLWEGEEGNYSGSFNITIPTSEPITKYKKLGLNICISNGNTNYYRELDVSVIMDIINASSGVYSMNNGHGNTSDYVDILSSSSISQLAISGYLSKVKKIIGISEGVQIPTGVQAARVTLWEGQYNTVNSPLQLSDSIENYDQFEMTLSTSRNEIGTFIRNVKDINYSGYNFRVYNADDTNYRYSMSVSFVDSTNFRIDTVLVSGWSDAYLLRITGIKYIQPDSYSTEEKLIGTWIDGKPLYRKVFTGLSITLQWNDKYFAYRGDISLPLSDVDTLVSANGYGDTFSMPVTININKTTNLFGICGVDVWTINKLVIEYTKN